MPLLHTATEEKKNDIRMLERGLQKGQLSQKTLDDMRNAMPDDSAHAVLIKMDDIEGWDGKGGTLQGHPLN